MSILHFSCSRILPKTTTVLAEIGNHFAHLITNILRIVAMRLILIFLNFFYLPAPIIATFLHVQRFVILFFIPQKYGA